MDELSGFGLEDDLGDPEGLPERSILITHQLIVDRNHGPFLHEHHLPYNAAKFQDDFCGNRGMGFGYGGFYRDDWRNGHNPMQVPMVTVWHEADEE